VGSVAWRFVLVAASAALLAAGAQAQEPPPDPMRACVAVGDNAARLSCYDNAVARAADGELPQGDISLLDGRWELDNASKRGVFRIRPYKPVYLAPWSWMSDRNTAPRTPNPDTSVTEPQDLDSVEAKFQLSMKFKLAQNLFRGNMDLWGAYTQVSRWQVYNSEISRPFRETNYEPELMLVVRTDYSLLGWKGRLAGVGLNHQSNGRSDPLSRSWNRVIFMIGLDRENWALMVRPWLRIDEDAEDDDNPDISDYIGRFDATLVRTWKMHQISLMGRHSLHGGTRSHGAVQLEWSFPIHAYLRGRVQIFHGYGESLIDYNFKATWASIGLSLVEWY